MSLLSILVVLVSMYFVQHVLGVIVLLGYFDQKQIRAEQGIYDVSVIIPFRDEALRIEPLLESIDQLEIPASLEVEFIFVDDHSSDHSAQIVRNKLKTTFRIVQAKSKGKKAAIKLGVEEASHSYIITWDADVVIPNKYFVQLIQYPSADMLILPVKMESNNLMGGLASIEFYWLQMLTYASAKWQSPLLCNGANLVFKKKTFDHVMPFRKDEDQVSGDDIFLMNAILKDNGYVRAYCSKNVQVNTLAPSSFKELIAQRKRWAGKMKSLLDIRSILLGLLMICLSFGTLVSLMLLPFEWLFIIPLGMKLFNELLVLLIYTKGRQALKQIFFVIIHQVWHPLYLLVLFFSRPKDVKWRLE
ncbi:MAG: glycosyltransferase [Crocinitomicaceae bacterium]|nr:glycosyltransferase [Crocinitomicaceae bacterium]